MNSFPRLAASLRAAALVGAAVLAAAVPLAGCSSTAGTAAAGGTAGTAASGTAPTASAPRFGDEWAGVPGAATMADLRVPANVADLTLTVYPTPRKVAYGDVLLPLDGARYVDETTDDVDAVLRAAGLEIGFRELPAEGYALAVTWDRGRATVLLAAKDDAGHRWASLALEQVTTTVGGRRVARACRVLDAPVFPLRGNKRPQAWERRYRANFAWEVREGPEYEGLETVATCAPGSPLDATREAVDRILDGWKLWQDRGVRRFCVKFDDVGFEMTAETESRCGTYAAAVRSLVSSLRTGLREHDPGAVLYFLPQTYWWNDPRLGAYARALRGAGGIGEDVGLVVTGPDVISVEIDAAGVAGIRDRFGSVATAALVYDNLGREGDWGPLTGRDPALASLCDAVFGERGTPVNRLTRLDWLWNPADYDAERSWRRAVLELAGPSGYAPLLAACDAFRRGAPREEIAALVERFAKGPAPAGVPVAHPRLAALLREDLSRLEPRAVAAATRP